jgi:hypothetical protein
LVVPNPTQLVEDLVLLGSTEGSTENYLTPAVKVQLHGDLIRDTSSPPLALDGNHLPPWLPYVPKTGDGIAGGLFESWLWFDT